MLNVIACVESKQGNTMYGYVGKCSFIELHEILDCRYVFFIRELEPD